MPVLEEQGPDYMLFRQDGAPPYFLKSPNFYSNEVAVAGVITWPPHSPDLTPIDLLFCLNLLVM
jgi:hypothetical protein